MADASPATARLAQLQAMADAGAVVQRKPPHPGGNPRGRGGRGQYKPQPKPPRRSDKGSWINEQRRKQDRGKPKPSARQQGFNFARPAANPPNRAAPQGRPGPMAPVGQGPVNPAPQPRGQRPPVNHTPWDFDDDQGGLGGEFRLNVPQGWDDDLGDYSGSENGDRSFGERIRAKAFEGRTFSDTFNTLGGVGYFAGDTTGAWISIASGAGVLLAGLKEYYSAVIAQPDTAAEWRENIYDGLVSGGDFVSGATAICAGIFALKELAENDSSAENSGPLGTASLVGMAFAEATNVIKQLDIIVTLRNETGDRRRSNWRFVKPVLSCLESLFKCVGCVIGVIGAMDPGMVVMLVGTGAGVLHGIIKLLLICAGVTEDRADRDEPDIADIV